MLFPPKRYLVTSALPYANGPLHIGHLAGAYLSADIYVRYLRLMGKDVVSVCGSDEHGAAITIKALKEGKGPKEIVDQFHAMFREAFEKIGISFDIYHRTSEKIHHETSQGFFRTLHEKGEFVEEWADRRRLSPCRVGGEGPLLGVPWGNPASPPRHGALRGEHVVRRGATAQRPADRARSRLGSSRPGQPAPARR